MGGKSRKSGEVSKRLIERLKKGDTRTNSCGAKKPKNRDSLFDLDTVEKRKDDER